MATITELLAGNSYPGRGILLGHSTENHAVLAYFIMGRSENSRNRVFAKTDDGIQTQAHDPAKLEDPSLIIYHPVRTWDEVTIVTNGDQTDTIWNHLKSGSNFVSALKTRTFEPDGPHFTPRISGVLSHKGGYALSILKSLDGDDACCARQFFHYDTPIAGTGHFIHTYQMDASPLPSFAGEPKKVSITAPTATHLASEIWNALDVDNRISLYVEYRNLETGAVDSALVNKHQ